MFKYQNYFIATDANHVTQHRRIVTPWFYVRLKSIKYVKVNDLVVFYDCFWFCMAGHYSGWCIDKEKKIIHNFGKNDLDIKVKLETVTAPFSFDERLISNGR